MGNQGVFFSNNNNNNLKNGKAFYNKIGIGAQRGKVTVAALGYTARFINNASS